MNVYRITKRRYAEDMSGTGAFINGGRWNSPGKYALYTSENPSLCTLEARVHLKAYIPGGFVMVRYELPENYILDVHTLGALPDGWNRVSPYHLYTVVTGDRFLHSTSHLALRIPSIVVDNQFNFLINPLHPQVRDIKILAIDAFHFDKRLF